MIADAGDSVSSVRSHTNSLRCKPEPQSHPGIIIVLVVLAIFASLESTEHYTSCSLATTMGTLVVGFCCRLTETFQAGIILVTA